MMVSNVIFLFLLCIRPMMTAMPIATVDTRTNFCSLGQRVANGTALMTTVLTGRTITVGVDPSISTNSNPLRSTMLTFDPATGLPNGGHIFTSLNQIATTLRITINWVQLPPQGSQSDLTYVTSSAQLVDIVAAYYVQNSAAYRSFNTIATQAILFSPSILVTTISTPNQVGYWDFAIPFSRLTWALIVLTFSFNGISYYIVKKRPQEMNENEVGYHSSTLVSNLFNSINNFAGEKLQHGDNFSSMILTVAFNMFCFIAVSCYTSNLTNVFVSYAVPQQPTVLNIQSANINMQKICVQSGTAQTRYLNQRYPDIKVIEAPFPQYLLNVNAGICDGAIVNLRDWQFLRGMSAYNPSDNLLQVDTLIDTANMFVTSADTTIKCSAFLNDAVGTAILSVQQSNYFQSTYDKSVNGLIDFTTQYVNGVNPPSDPVLSVSSMIGIFIVYVIVIGCVLVVQLGLSVYTYIFPKNRRESITSDINRDKEADRSARGFVDSIPDEWQNAEPDEIIDNNYTGEDMITTPPSMVTTALSPFRTGGMLDITPVAGVIPDLYKGSWDATVGLHQQTMSLLTGAPLSDPNNSKLEQIDGMDDRVDMSNVPSSSSTYYDDNCYDNRGPPPPIPPSPLSSPKVPSPIRSPFFFTPRKNTNGNVSSVAVPSIAAAGGIGNGQSHAMSNAPLMTKPWGSPPSIQTPNLTINTTTNQLPQTPSPDIKHQRNYLQMNQ